MTFLAALVMLAGMGALMFLPLHKKRHMRIATQALGVLLFASGLLGLIYQLATPAT